VNFASETKAWFVIVNVIVRLQRANTGFFVKSLTLTNNCTGVLTYLLQIHSDDWSTYGAVNRLFLWESGPGGGGRLHL